MEQNGEQGVGDEARRVDERHHDGGNGKIARFQAAQIEQRLLERKLAFDECDKAYDAHNNSAEHCDARPAKCRGARESVEQATECDGGKRD